MSNPHTPLPWSLNEYSNYFGFSIMGPDGFGCIAERWEDTVSVERHQQMHANAAFIVEACNSYATLRARAVACDRMEAALKNLIDEAALQAVLLKMNTPNAPSLPDLMTALTKARAAIAFYAESVKSALPDAKEQK